VDPRLQRSKDLTKLHHDVSGRENGAVKRVVTMLMPNGFCYLVIAFSTSDRSSLIRTH
jgi:hypothetical protein